MSMQVREVRGAIGDESKWFIVQLPDESPSHASWCADNCNGAEMAQWVWIRDLPNRPMLATAMLYDSISMLKKAGLDAGVYTAPVPGNSGQKYTRTCEAAMVRRLLREYELGLVDIINGS
ncbi:MAG: hypothetical protein ACRDAX_06040 [Propionibacteriaceae bacterium]